MGMEQHTSAKSAKFPFRPQGVSRVSLIDFRRLIHPYVRTNGSFYRCPTDRGPMNFLLGEAAPEVGSVESIEDSD